MMMIRRGLTGRAGIYALAVVFLVNCSCSKEKQQTVTPPPSSFVFSGLKVNGVYNGFTYKGVNTSPVIAISFSTPVSHTSVANAVSFTSKTGTAVNYTTSYQDN